MRRFVDGVLGVGDSAFTVTNLASDKVASGLQLLQRRADGVHALLADGGKPAGGVVPLICQREHFGHEAIVDRETYDIVQRIRNGRRRRTPMGEMPLLSGMVFCADCGAKLYQVRSTTFKPGQEYMVCATYRKKGKDQCTSHQIRNSVIEEFLLDGIRSMTAYVREHEDEFVEMVTKLSKAETEKALRDEKRELEQAEARVHKLDTIIQRLYEDNVEGKISDERFAKMSENYESEQKLLERRTIELRSRIAAQKESSMNVNSFVALVRKHTDIQELNAEVIREFVERVEVFQPARVGGRKVQRLRIVWNCIGEFTPPQL